MTATLPPAHTTHVGRLYPALHEMLPLLAGGLTYEQMARRLNITREGVRSRMVRLFKLLDARNGAQAVAIAYQRGLLQRDTQHANRVRRELADRHRSTCALLTRPVCDCGAARTHRNGADPRP